MWIIVDGTHEICRKVFSIVIRFSDDDLQPIELFFGLYEIKYTTGRASADMICNVLIW